MPTTIEVQAVVDLLNSAISCDRSAVEALLRQRVPCNRALADHPLIVVDVAGFGFRPSPVNLEPEEIERRGFDVGVGGVFAAIGALAGGNIGAEWDFADEANPCLLRFRILPEANKDPGDRA